MTDSSNASVRPDQSSYPALEASVASSKQISTSSWKSAGSISLFTPLLCADPRSCDVLHDPSGILRIACSSVLDLERLGIRFMGSSRESMGHRWANDEGRKKAEQEAEEDGLGESSDGYLR